MESLSESGGQSSNSRLVSPFPPPSFVRRVGRFFEQRADQFGSFNQIPPRYPWGLVEVDNPKHSDTGALRGALLSSHLTDLKEVRSDRSSSSSSLSSSLTTHFLPLFSLDHPRLPLRELVRPSADTYLPFLSSL